VGGPKDTSQRGPKTRSLDEWPRGRVPVRYVAPVDPVAMFAASSYDKVVFL
jgi:hypothetical protein